MSISTTDTSATFTGNSSTSTAYQIPFKYLEDSHLKVIGVFPNKANWTFPLLAPTLEMVTISQVSSLPKTHGTERPV